MSDLVKLLYIFEQEHVLFSNMSRLVMWVFNKQNSFCNNLEVDF